MDITVWLALLGLFAAGGLTPGPAVMLVVSSSLVHGFRAAMLPAVGIAAANLVWIALAAGGIATLAVTLPSVFLALKLAGVIFLLWLAVSMVRSGARDLRLGRAGVPRRADLFAKGVGLQLSNPNALVFFGLLLPNYFSIEAPLWPQVLIIMATITVTELFGLAVYAALANALARRFTSPRFARTFNIVAALVMLGSAMIALWATA